MTRLLALAFGLLSAAGGSTLEVPAFVPGAAGLLAQEAPHRAARAELDSGGDCAGDLEEIQEGPDQGLPDVPGTSGPGAARRRARRSPPAPACPNLLLAAPKTGPPPLRTSER